MRFLTILDQLFLLLENRKQPMHVGGLFLFELPKDADVTFVHSLVKQMQTSDVPPTFPFNQVLHNLTFWKTDSDFDVEYHFRHIALPKPAKVRELLSYISKEHGRLLDRARPLWECHIIEGIEPVEKGRPERFALYLKIHHSLVDGIAAMRLVQKSLSQSPNEVMSLPLWSLMMRHRNIVDALIPVERSARKVFKEQLRTIFPVAKELKRSFLERHEPSYVSTFEAPMSILNQRISSSRRFVAQSYEKSRFARIATHLDVSTNDVVLAVCSGALRKYLLSLSELPIDPLIAFVPISLRKDNSASGNQLSFLLCNLGTHLTDPLQRVRTINESMNNGKERFGRMNQPQAINYSIIAYALEFAKLITGSMPKNPGFNLIISNVPGSKRPLYWNGAKLQALYPASVLFDGQALNITLASYLDRIEFGITACRQVLPKVQNLLHYLADELTVLEKICDERELGIRE